jgi:hypothetical protein
MLRHILQVVSKLQAVYVELAEGVGKLQRDHQQNRMELSYVPSTVRCLVPSRCGSPQTLSFSQVRKYGDGRSLPQGWMLQGMMGCTAYTGHPAIAADVRGLVVPMLCGPMLS